MTRARPDTAAAWVARLGSDQRTRADEAAFDAWLTADPAHAAQYAEHAELWDGLGATVEARLPDESRTVSELSGTADAREGLAAVIEKRRPKFSGR